MVCISCTEFGALQSILLCTQVLFEIKEIIQCNCKQNAHEKEQAQWNWNYSVMFKLHDCAIVIKCENSSNWVRKSFGCSKLY